MDKKFGIRIKTDTGNTLTFYTDSYTETDYHIKFIDIENKPHMFHLSWVVEVFPFDKSK
jgi:hypothetical protein